MTFRDITNKQNEFKSAVSLTRHFLSVGHCRDSAIHCAADAAFYYGKCWDYAELVNALEHENCL